MRVCLTCCSESSLVRENARLLARVHENRGNILVYARVRPPNDEELATDGVVEVVDVLSDTEVALYDASKRCVAAGVPCCGCVPPPISRHHAQGAGVGGC